MTIRVRASSPKTKRAGEPHSAGYLGAVRTRTLLILAAVTGLAIIVAFTILVLTAPK